MTQKELDKELVSLKSELTSVGWILRCMRRKAFLSGKYYSLRQIHNVCHAIEFLQNEISRLDDDVKEIIEEVNL